MVRALVPVLLFAAALAPPAHAIVNPDGAGRVPSQVLVNARLSAGAYLRCGGTVRDALHVATAAHCTYDRADRPLPASALTVVAGVSSALAPEPTAQRREVVAVSSDPDFARAGPSAVHDDAILTLEEPFDLSRPEVVRALPLADPGESARGGAFAGWGRTSPRAPGGTLHHAAIDVLGPRACSTFGGRYVAAWMLCAGRVHADGRATGGCNGDSGGGLVHDGRLLGIASFVGPKRCGDRRFPTVFTRIGAPAINAFLPQPQPRPRPVRLEAPSLAGAARALRCRPGKTAGAMSMPYAFERAPLVGHPAEPARGVVVAPFSPSDTYLPISRDIGAAIFCIVRAANSGGAASAT